jgi:hypothetical protein
MTKTQSNDVPENLWRNEVFHDRGDYQGQARADHHHAPGDPSPLEAEYIFADCSRRNRFFLQFGGPYIFAITLEIYFSHRETPLPAPARISEKQWLTRLYGWMVLGGVNVEDFRLKFCQEPHNLAVF